MQEIYVIRDPEGNDTDPCFKRETAVFIAQTLEEYMKVPHTIHLLHVYNPETQVVISRECYGMLLDHAIQPSKSMYFSDFDKVWALWQEFIKAGNNPLVPIDDTTNE